MDQRHRAPYIADYRLKIFYKNTLDFYTVKRTHDSFTLQTHGCFFDIIKHNFTHAITITKYIIFAPHWWIVVSHNNLNMGIPLNSGAVPAAVSLENYLIYLLPLLINGKA